MNINVSVITLRLPIRRQTLVDALGGRQFLHGLQRVGEGLAGSDDSLLAVLQGLRQLSVLDGVNQKWGRGTVRLLPEGIDKNWSMRRGNLSPAYTTSWDELPKILAR